MTKRLFVIAAFAAFVLAAGPAAAAPCCEEGKMCAMACCKEPADNPLLAMVNDMTLTAPQAEPAVRATKVLFQRPTRVGTFILMGPYIIEHDTDRMARGEPCTHIYAVGDRRTPVVAFHCEHLDRGTAEKGTVTLRTVAALPGIVELTEFQFKGETAAHGVPGIR